MAEESVDGSDNGSHVQGEAFTTINGVQLHYEVRGNGTHPVICIPGALGSARSHYEPQLNFLDEKVVGLKLRH